MKIVKMIIGVLAAFWGLGCLTEFLLKGQPNPGGPFFVTQLMAAIFGMAVGSAICIACFKSALKKPDDANRDE